MEQQSLTYYEYVSSDVLDILFFEGSSNAEQSV